MTTVYAVLTDDPSRGGSLYSIKATAEEAVEAAKKLGSPRDAIVLPWQVGTERWDDVWCRVSNDRKTLDLIRAQIIGKRKTNACCGDPSCRWCQGSGVVEGWTCPSCDGVGAVGDDLCRDCLATGILNAGDKS